MIGEEGQIVVIDLSVPLDEATPLYSDPRGYGDPPTLIAEWIGIGQSRGTFTSPFRVSQLQMGLHTGTHLDAPAHFHPGAATVEALAPDSLVGWAVVCDLSGLLEDDAAQAALAGRRAAASLIGSLPLILTPAKGLGPLACDELIVWHRPLIAFAGPLDEDPDCPRTAALLGAGTYLATDLNPVAARRVRDGDLLIVAPLPLRGVEGAPCRVMAVRLPSAAGLCAPPNVPGQTR